MHATIWDATRRVEIDGRKLELYDTGRGEPVVFIHGSMGDECAAMLQEPALTSSYRVIHYHRPGYGASRPADPPLSITQQAELCATVLRHLDVSRAHIVGQSGGGVIALQLALAAPEIVHSIALLEAAVPAALHDAVSLEEAFSEAAARYEAGDAESAIEVFATEVCGEGYRAEFDRTLPDGYLERWAAEIDAVFADAEAEEAWTFTAESAARITSPTLNMTGSRTTTYLRKAYDVLRSWIPHAENVTLPDSSHAMLQTNPSGAAERLADFFARHPIRHEEHVRPL